MLSLLLSILMFNIGYEPKEFIYHRYFLNAGITDSEVEIFYRYMQSEKVVNVYTEAYKAVSEMMMASVVWNPYAKVKYFDSGKQKLEACIKKNNRNAELRFLRLTVQVKCPAVLGYSKQIEEDKKLVVEACYKNELSSDKSFVLKAKIFLKENLKLTDYEKQKLYDN